MRRVNATWIAALAMLASACVGAPPADAQTIIETWKTVVVPPPPPPQKATIDTAHTALLILDMYEQTCTTSRRPRCVTIIPNVKRLLDQARAHKMLVVYTAGPPNSPTQNTQLEALKPLSSEQTLHAGADKWVNSDLEKVLTKAGIKSIIPVGTSADGAVMYTASGAALRGMTAIVPVDGIASINPFGELYTVYHLKNTAATVSSHVVITRTDLMTFN